MVIYKMVAVKKAILQGNKETEIWKCLQHLHSELM